MKKGVTFAVVLLALFLMLFIPGDTIASGNSRKNTWSVDRMMDAKVLYGTSLSPDGKWLAYCVEENVIGEEVSKRSIHIWLSKTDGSHGFQLTNGDAHCYSPSWSPDGKWIAFTTTRGGKNDIWLIPPLGGEAVQLTDGVTDVYDFKWSPDGSYIAFRAANPKSESEKKAVRTKVDPTVLDTNWKYVHLYKVKIADTLVEKQPGTRVTSGAFSVSDFDWSPDCQRFVFTHQPTPASYQWRNTDISIISASGGKVTPLVRNPGMDSSPLFSPDGSQVAFVSVRGNNSWGRDFRICLISAKGGEVTVLPRTYDCLPDNIMGTLDGWSKNGKEIYYLEWIGTDVHVFAMPTDGRPYRRLTDRPGDKFSISIVQRGGETLIAYCGSDFDKPYEVYVERIKKGKAQVQQVTRQNIHLADMVYGRSEVIRWPSYDGMFIEGILTYPPDYEKGKQKGKRYPLILYLHGGPTGSWARAFTADTMNKVQYFAAEGFLVLQPNVRGSNAYGKEFRFAGLKECGKGDAKDAIAGADFVIAKGIADPERLGAYGWSYGSSLAAMLLSHDRRFKAAVCGAGVMDYISFSAQSYAYGMIPSYHGCEFSQCPDQWQEGSPVYRSDKIDAPILFIYGKHDPYNPPWQGQELFRLLQRRGVETQFVLYPRSGHWVYEPKMQMDLARRIIDWMKKYVKR